MVQTNEKVYKELYCVSHTYKTRYAMAFYESTVLSRSGTGNTKCILETYSETTQIWLMDSEHAIKFPPNAFPIEYEPTDMNTESASCTYCDTVQSELTIIIGAEENTIPNPLFLEFGVIEFPVGLYMVQICSECVSQFNKQAEHLWETQQSDIFLDQL